MVIPTKVLYRPDNRHVPSSDMWLVLAAACRAPCPLDACAIIPGPQQPIVVVATWGTLVYQSLTT